jgi:serine/threonine-protein kinase
VPPAQNNNHPGLLAERYRVVAPVGEGAHATTWRGRDERLDRPVAIKMLHAHLANDPVFVERFRAEAKVAASVRQSNVVDVYDFGQQDGTLYIVMQYVDGEDLKSLIQRSAPMPTREVRRIIGHVLDGLQAIHAAGIVHRDIKPQNVLIGSDGVARVSDFGIADVSGSAGLTGEGLTIGTVDYMAPEQAQGLALTPAADLYATGVMLYEMLTGTLPFAGRSSRETMLQHINGQLTPPSTRLPEHGITPAIDAVVAQSLAKDPARRFGSARAMKQAVGNALSSAAMASSTQATTVMQAQPQTAPARQQPVYQQPAYTEPVYRDDAGAGLNSAFKSLLALLLIGALGVVAWGAWQLMDGEGMDVPTVFNSQQDAEPTLPPTATDVPNQQVPIEPDANDNVEQPPVEQPPVEQPTQVPPTLAPTEAPTEEPTEAPTVAVEPTSAPLDTEPAAPIELIEPNAPEPTPTETTIEPAG